MKIKRIGEIQVENTLFVTDPCYYSPECSIPSPLSGRWIVSVTVSDEGSWGKRIASLEIAHENFTEENVFETRRQGSTGVDSGQAGFFTSLEDCSEENYSQICDLTLSDEQAGIFQNSCVSSTGFGDGSYPVECFFDYNLNIIKARIIYIPTGEEVSKEQILSEVKDLADQLEEIKEDYDELCDRIKVHFDSDFLLDVLSQIANITDELNDFIHENS